MEINIVEILTSCSQEQERAVADVAQAIARANELGMVIMVDVAHSKPLAMGNHHQTVSAYRKLVR